MPTTTTTTTTTVANGSTTTTTTTVTTTAFAAAPTAEEAVPPAGAPAAADTPFVLTATMKAKEGGVEKFLEWSKAVDKAVEDVETGMLMHTLNATDDPLTFTWVEVYQNDAALHAHLGNPAVGEALAQAPELIDGPMTIELYGEIAPETKAFAEGLGMGVVFKERKLGFSGMFAPRNL